MKIRPRNEPKRRELSRVLAHYSRGPCGARLRRRAGPPAALAVVGWWQVPWSSAMRMARLLRGRSTDESTYESTTDEVHWTQVPAPPRGHVAAYLPHQCLQSRRNPIRNPISDGAEKRQLHRSYLLHAHARTRTQANTHARTYTHTDSACVERAHAGATSMTNLPQPLLCFETTPKVACR